MEIYGIYLDELLTAQPKLETPPGKPEIELKLFKSEESARDSYAMLRDTLFGVDGLLYGRAGKTLDEYFLISGCCVYAYNDHQDEYGRFLAVFHEKNVRPRIMPEPPAAEEDE